MPEDINKEMIIIARETRAINQKELALKIGVKQGTISKIENGFLKPDSQTIERIAQALNYPKSFFFQKQKPIPITVFYRKKQTTPQKELKNQQAKMIISEWHLHKLTQSVEITKNNTPSWDCDYNGNPQYCANYVRELWKVPKGKIENLTNLIENNGIVIIPLDLGTMDGMSVFSEQGIPIIFINKLTTTDRYRFNLAHELGHLIMHFSQKINIDRDVEKEANMFASEFLMPNNEIKPYLTKLTIQKLAELKAYWKVSMQSILVKAYKQTHIITKNQYQYLFKQISSLGYRKKEPIFLTPEEPTLLREIINVHINELEYSTTELSELLHLNENEFFNTYMKKSNLKIIT